MNKSAAFAVCAVLLQGAAFAAPEGQTELELVMTRNPDPAKGAELYATCAACHGTHGEGASDGTVPALAGQPYSVIAKQIVAFRAGLRADERMAHFTDRLHLSFSQPVADVAAYISRLQPPASTASSPPEASARGAMAYERSCERCHGALAEGSDDNVMPRLASQHFDYLMKQLDDAAEGRRRAMADAHARIVPAPTRAQLTAIARYLSSLQR